MSSDSLKNVTDTLFPEKSYTYDVYMYKQNFALNIPQGLIYH